MCPAQPPSTVFRTEHGLTGSQWAGGGEEVGMVDGLDVQGLPEGAGLNQLAVADRDGHVVNVVGGAVEEQVAGLVAGRVEAAGQLGIGGG